MAKKAKPSSKHRRSTPAPFALDRRPWFVPAVFGVFFIGLIILFRDFVFSDKMLYGSDTIQAGIFFRELLVNYVRTHFAIPQWNPYIFCGMPYVEAFHGDIFYPLSSLKYFGSIYRMLGWNLFWHIFLAGIFMYLAARQFKLDKIPALLSGVCYMYAGYLVSLVAPGHDGKIFVTTLFPLVILFLDRGFERRPFLNFTLMGLVIGVIILSPHPQMSYYTLWAAALYTLFKLFFRWRETSEVVPLIKPAGLAVYAVVIGLLLSAIQFYPGYIYTTHFSPRADTKSGWEWSTSWSLHEEEAMSLLIPEFPGTSSEQVTTYYWGKNSFKDNSEAVGAVTFFLGLMGFLFVRRREKYFFGGLALLALLYGLGGTTPVYKVFFHLVPKVKALRAPSMIMFLFSFSASLLAGMFIQRLIDWTRDREITLSPKLNYVLLGFPGLMLLLALLFSAAGRGMLSFWLALFYSEAKSVSLGQGMTKFDVAMANLPAIQSGAWFAFLFTALAAGCLWLLLKRKAGVGILLVVVALPLVDGVRFNARFVNTFDQRHFQENALTQYVKQSTGDARAVNLLSGYPADMLPHHGVAVVGGYHGNQLRWFDALMGGTDSQQRFNPHFINLAGGRKALVAGNQNLPPGFFGPESVTLEQNFGSLKLFDNPNALPRVYLADQFRVMPDQEAIIAEVRAGSTDLRSTVLLQEQPELAIVPNPDSMAVDSAWIIHYDLDTVLIGVESSHDQLLVMTDTWFDAWHATVDGNPAKTYRAYNAFRAVEVPAGTKQVAFKYNSERYRTGRLVTWLTCLYLVVVLGFSGWQSRRRQESSTGDEE